MVPPTRRCPDCGSPTGAGERFCRDCGADMEPPTPFPPPPSLRHPAPSRAARPEPARDTRPSGRARDRSASGPARDRRSPAARSHRPRPLAGFAVALVGLLLVVAGGYGGYRGVVEGRTPPRPGTDPAGVEITRYPGPATTATPTGAAEGTSRPAAQP